MMNSIALLGALWFCTGADLGPGPKAEGRGVPLARLPPHVPAAAGQLSLFADFNKQQPGQVPLYILNRTGKPVTLTMYNGRPFIEMEYQAAQARWARAQVRDLPLCGNSLYTLTLHNDAFLVVQGYVPLTGFKAKVRFRFFDGDITCSSNVGAALVSQEALNFLLVSETEDFGLLSKIALGQEKVREGLANLRELAIRRLAEVRFDPRKAEAVLRRIAGGSQGRYAAVARDALKFMRLQNGGR
jgi:hypothetical protein